MNWLALVGTPIPLEPLETARSFEADQSRSVSGERQNIVITSQQQVCVKVREGTIERMDFRYCAAVTVSRDP